MIQELSESTLIHINQEFYSIYIEVWDDIVVANVFENKKQVLNVSGTIQECLQKINNLISDTRKS